MLGKRKGEREQFGVKLAKTEELMTIHKELEVSLPVEILTKIFAIFGNMCEDNNDYKGFLDTRSCCTVINNIVLEIFQNKIRQRLAENEASMCMSLGDYFERMDRLGINYKMNLEQLAKIPYQLTLDIDLFTEPEDPSTVLELDAKLPLGVSKYGGWPHLPNDWHYPQFTYEWESTPRNLEFMMQIRCKDLLEYDLYCVIPETGILYFFMGPDDNKGALLYFPSDDVSSLVRKPPPKIEKEQNDEEPEEQAELEEPRPQFFHNCGLIERKNFFGREHEAEIVMLTTEMGDNELDELELDNAEEYSFCFLTISGDTYCMTGAIVTNPKKFAKKPFAKELIYTLLSTD